MLSRGATEAWIVGAVRAPTGEQGGALSPVRPDDLAALARRTTLTSTRTPSSG